MVPLYSPLIRGSARASNKGGSSGLGMGTAGILFWLFLLELVAGDGVDRARRLSRLLAENRIRKQGDVELGGLVSVHTELDSATLICTGYDVASLLAAQAIIYEVDRVNRDPDILPNLTLGYEIADDCYSPELALKAALSFVAGDTTQLRRRWISEYRMTGPWMPSPKVAVIGPASSDAAIAVASVASVNLMPVVSYGASTGQLSEKNKYPSFVRTVPSDALQIMAMTELVRRFNWSWVMAIGSDDTYGQFAVQNLKEALLARNVCLAKELLLDYRLSPEAMRRTLDVFFSDPLARSANVVFLITSGANVERFLRATKELGVFNKTWIASQSWGFRRISADLKDVVEGALGLAVDGPEAGDFATYMNELSVEEIRRTNRWLYEYLIDQGLLNRTSISATATLSQLGFSVGPLRYSVVSNVLDAVRATAVSLHRAQRTGSIRPVDILRALRTGTFVSSADPDRRFSFDRGGDVRCGYGYTYTNLRLDSHERTLRFFPVGGWDGGCDDDRFSVRLDESAIVWPGGASVPPQSKCQDDCQPGSYRIFGGSRCCWTCKPCPDGEYSDAVNSGRCERCPPGMLHNRDRTACVYGDDYADWRSAGELVALTLAAIGLVADVIVASILFTYRRTPVVVCSNAPLTFILLYLLALAFALPPIYVFRPTTGLCFAETVLFGWTFSTITAIFFTKTYRVLRIFTAKLSDTLHVLSQRGLQRREVWMSLGLGGFVLLPTVPYLAVYEPVPPADDSGDCGRRWVHVQLINMAYIGLLSLATTYVSFRARNLPENYNEAHSVATTMLMLLLVWLSSLPSYNLSPYRVSMANRALILGLAVDAAALAVLVLVFGPKLHLIFAEPHKNTAVYVSRTNMIHLWKQESKRRRSSATNAAHRHRPDAPM